jgi:hypothetical protein
LISRKGTTALSCSDFDWIILGYEVYDFITKKQIESINKNGPQQSWGPFL